jgi:hypothetical protein
LLVNAYAHIVFISGKCPLAAGQSKQLREMLIASRNTLRWEGNTLG